MPGPFSFGDTILAVLQNEQQFQEQQRQFGIESGFRSRQLDLEQQNQAFQRSIEQQRMAMAMKQFGLQSQQFDWEKEKYNEENPLIGAAAGRAALNEAGLPHLADAMFGVPRDTVANDIATIPGNTIASRSNNPLNLQVGTIASKYGGVAGESNEDGTYAKFPSVAAGLAAAKDQLMQGTYRNLSVKGAMEKWSHYHFDEKKQKWVGYSDNIVPEDLRGKEMKDLGNADYDRLIAAMAQRESSTKLGVPSSSDIAPTLGNGQIRSKAFDAIMANVERGLRIQGQTEENKAKANLYNAQADQLAEIAKGKAATVASLQRSLEDNSGLLLGNLSTANPDSGISSTLKNVINAMSFSNVGSVLFSNEITNKINMSKQMEKVRPGLSSILNSIDGVTQAIMSGSPVTDQDVNTAMEQSKVLEGMENKNVNWDEKFAFGGKLYTLREIVDLAKSRLSAIVGSKFDIPSMMADIKNSSQQNAILNRQQQFETFKQENK